MRLWDISSGKCVRTFIAKSEVNAVCMFPNGGAIAYATEQGQFGLFDVGSYACVSEGKTASKGAAMSVAVSRSGRVTYVGFEKGAISVCDTFDMSQYDGVTSGHERCACSAYGRPRAPTNIPTDPNPYLTLHPNPKSSGGRVSLGYERWRARQYPGVGDSAAGRAGRARDLAVGRRRQ